MKIEVKISARVIEDYPGQLADAPVTALEFASCTQIRDTRLGPGYAAAIDAARAEALRALGTSFTELRLRGGH